MADDELISAYIDGQLNSTEQAALEARIDRDVALRQQIAATRLLVGEARLLPAPSLPRHFALPDVYARPTRRSRWDGRWLYRAASLLSAGLCAVLFAIDAGQWAGRNATPQQAMARTMTPISGVLSPTSGYDAQPLAVTTSVTALLPLSTPTKQPASTLQANQMVRSVVAETVVLRTSENTATPVATASSVGIPKPTITPLLAVPQTPLPTLVIGPDVPGLPVSLLPRALAALAGLSALFFAGLGWRQR